MDFYQKNPLTLRKLLAKRQNPCAQIFKQQPSNPTNPPKTQVNPQKKTVPTKKKTEAPSKKTLSPQKTQNNPQIIFTSPLTDDLSTSPFLPNDCPLFIQKSTTESTDCEGSVDSFEPLQKKVKTSTVENIPKKTSFDEESDRSTVCDTHSEGSPYTEAHDFIKSPSLEPQTSKDAPFMKLDDEIPLKVESPFHSLSSDEDIFLFVKAQSQKVQINESYLSSNDGLFQSKEKIKCEFRHRYRFSSGVKQGSCSKCCELLHKCQQFAKENGGLCFNDKFEETIHYSCSKGHRWSVNHKYFDAGWCSTCVQEEKDYLRKKCEEERLKREKIEEEYQKKLFEEARQKAMENITCQGTYTEENVLAYFQKIDLEVENLAKEDANKFMSHKDETINVSYYQTVQVYKVLIMPEYVLEKYMMSLNSEVLKCEFRRMAKLIHPDKNKHPNAGQAFQKIHKVYECVVGRFE